jgi:predicted RNA-binding protein YlxR (DUF448 family)
VVRGASPVRTCVGCRKRAEASELLRVVAVERDGESIVIEPDPTRVRRGRGAHLHPDPACLALAERRRAFGRALRVSGVLDTGPLAALLATPGTPGGARSPHDSKVGRPS